MTEDFKYLDEVITDAGVHMPITEAFDELIDKIVDHAHEHNVNLPEPEPYFTKIINNLTGDWFSNYRDFREEKIFESEK